MTVPSPGGGIPEYVPFSTAPVTVSRSFLDQAQHGLEWMASDAVSSAQSELMDRAAPAVDAVRGALPGTEGGGAGDADKTFEELYDRLKRELMIEQEQRGQLFHEP